MTVADGVDGVGSAGSPECAAAGVLAALGARGQTLAVAESLTGGLLAATIVDIPGASAVFRGGLVVYSTDLKKSLAGVDGALLADRGPVDAEVARQLARGAALRCGADWGLSTTGVAGPDPQNGIPAGTVYIGLSDPDGRTVSRRLDVAGDRPAVRRAAVASALTMIAESIPR